MFVENGGRLPYQSARKKILLTLRAWAPELNEHELERDSWLRNGYYKYFAKQQEMQTFAITKRWQVQEYLCKNFILLNQVG